MGFKGRNLQVEHPAAFGATQSDTVADDVQLSNGDRHRMRLKTGQQKFLRRRDRGRRRAGHFAAERHGSHSRHYLLGYQEVHHAAGGAGHEKPPLGIHPLQRETQGMDGETLLHERAALIPLPHSHLWKYQPASGFAYSFASASIMSTPTA